MRSSITQARASLPLSVAAPPVVLGSTAGLPSDDDEIDVFRFSVVTPAVAAADSGGDGDMDNSSYDHDKAVIYLANLSLAELRVVLRVLKIKGKMQAPMPLKRGLVLDAMEDRSMGDEELQALVDEELIVATPSPAPRSSRLAAVGARVVPTAPATNAVNGDGQGPRIAGAVPSGTQRAANSTAGTAPRDPTFSANDSARLAHVVTDAAHFMALQVSARPMTREQQEKERAGLLESVQTPAFTDLSYTPDRPNPVEGVLEIDLRSMDPNAVTTRRDASKLKTIYRERRSNYTTAYSNYSRSGQLDGGIFKDFIKGDHRLFHLHCVLHRNRSVDFVLRRLPLRAQTEIGLPDSNLVGRGPAHTGSTAVTKHKRARIMEVNIGGLEALTSAMKSMGQDMSGDGRGTALGIAADVHDNAEELGVVWQQLKIARAAEADDGDDEMARTMRVHLEKKLAKQMKMG